MHIYTRMITALHILKLDDSKLEKEPPQYEHWQVYKLIGRQACREAELDLDSHPATFPSKNFLIHVTDSYIVQISIKTLKTERPYITVHAPGWLL